MNKVLLKINARQHNREGQEDVVELLTEAKHYNKNGVVYLVYEETELSGVNGCVTALKVDGEAVKLRRYGTKGHEMHFEKGKKFHGLYETPVGFVDMEILTNGVKNELKADGREGLITIDYDISLRGLLEAHNTLEVSVADLNSPGSRKEQQS